MITMIRPENAGQVWMIRLFNPSDRTEEFVYRWVGSGSAAVYESDLSGVRLQRVRLPLVMPPMGVRVIRVERQ
jgi:hypothetical protein